MPDNPHPIVHPADDGDGPPPSSITDLEVNIINGLKDVGGSDWDKLAGEDNPFIEYAFLRGLEDTLCVGPDDTGWIPRHVLVSSAGRLVGALPLYEKHHSYGEYIFDWAWANAAQEAGISYYPKLVSAVPFTPATGRRLLVTPSLRQTEKEIDIVKALLAGVERVKKICSASSVHLLFVTDDEQRMLQSCAYMPRASYQFHWKRAAGWQDFGDYLAALRSSARKQVKRERRLANSHGLEFSTRRGTELSEADWNSLWQFYILTASRKWGHPYLNREFFTYLRSSLSHRVVASFAHRGSEAVAGALMFCKGSHLYGRYWGTHEQLDALHFELCYYQPIEWGLNNGITLFEAGAQGEHKLKRGLLPELTHSAHLVAHPALEHAVARFLPVERAAVDKDISVLREHSPYRGAC